MKKVNGFEYSDYKGMNIRELMKSCVHIIHIDPMSVADMQDIVASVPEEELAVVAMEDKETFLRITRETWNVVHQFEFYNKYMTPWIQKMSNREEELYKVVDEFQREVREKENELRTLKNAMRTIMNFMDDPRY